MKLRNILIIGYLTILTVVIGCEKYLDTPFKERIQPVEKETGFKMEGYYIWGGSIIKVNDTYHMFASRWPALGDFPYDYFKMSEIVRGTSENPEGPYKFQEVVIGERDSSYWDSNMAHNPMIYKIDGEYVLFYIGSNFTTLRNGSHLLRRVGYATATDIAGPWKRLEKPLIDVESNNPAIFVEADGSAKLVYRDEKLRIYMATAPSYMGPYTIKNDNVWPQAKLEDFYLFKRKGLYHMIVEDNVGHVTGHVRWGAHLVSEDGISDWRQHENKVAFNHDIRYTDGSVLEAVRRERPVLFIEDGYVKYLLTSVFDGTTTWCQPVKIDPPYKVD